jgi:hypothetical protein
VLDAEAEAEEEHAFFFSYGCVVFWGFNEDDEERITAQAKANFALQPLAKDEVRRGKGGDRGNGGVWGGRNEVHMGR